MHTQVGDLKGWDGAAFRLTIWGGPIVTAIVTTLFAVIGWPWIMNVSTAVAEVPHKLDQVEYSRVEQIQRDQFRELVEAQVTETRETLKTSTKEINDKLDRLIWEAREERLSR